MQFSSLQTEQQALTGLFKNPGLLPDIDTLSKEQDFTSKLNRVVFSVLRETILKNEAIDKVLIARKIEGLKIHIEEGISAYDYIDVISYKRVSEKATLEAFQEISKLRILREIAANAREQYEFVKANQTKALPEILAGCDGIYSKVNDIANKFNTGPINIFETLPDVVEGLADNPPDDSQLMMGALPTVNRIYGSLSRPGNITIIVSRSKGGKTAFSMFYNVYLAERYNLPILWMDQGEMSEKELQMRAACMFTQGTVPYWAIEQGKWRNNPIWFESIRAVWPRVKKIKFYYQDVSDMNPKEMISFIRRFSYKIGKDNMFLACYDYLKPLPLEGKYQSEWQQIGHFLNDIKKFINRELPIPFFAPIQANRRGIIGNKKPEDIDESEDVVSLSDRVTHYCSHAFLLRSKLPEEMAAECNGFGNLKMIGLVHRFLGQDYELALNPVKMGKTQVKNYINLEHKSFWFRDMGDLNFTAQKLKEKFYPKAEAPEEKDETCLD